MKSNKLLISCAALVVVVLIIVVSEKLSNSKPSDKSIKFFPTVTEKNISSVLIEDEKDTVKIFKKGDVWMVSGKNATTPMSAAPSAAAQSVGTTGAAPSEYSADSASVATMLEKIAGMKKETEVSNNPSKQSLYEVDSVKGVYVEVWDNEGKSAGAFRIGKNGADWSSHFVRAIGSNTVYAVGGSIRYSFFTDKKRWRDHTILRFDRASAKKISLLKRDGTLITLAKAADTGSSWNLIQPINSPAKTDQVNELLEKLSFMSANDFQDTVLADTAMGFGAPELIVTVNLGGETNKKIIVGKQKGTTKNFWVRAEGKDMTFIVSDYDIQKLDKNVDGLKVAAPASTPNPTAAAPTSAAPGKPFTLTPAPAKPVAPSKPPKK